VPYSNNSISSVKLTATRGRNPTHLPSFFTVSTFPTVNTRAIRPKAIHISITSSLSSSLHPFFLNVLNIRTIPFVAHAQTGAVIVARRQRSDLRIEISTLPPSLWMARIEDQHQEAADHQQLQSGRKSRGRCLHPCGDRRI